MADLLQLLGQLLIICTLACQLPVEAEPCYVRDGLSSWMIITFLKKTFVYSVINTWRHMRVSEKKGEVVKKDKGDSCGVMEGLRPRPVQSVRGLVRQLAGISHWLKWRVMAGLDWHARWPLRLMKGATGRQMRVWWERTHQMEWWTKRSKFGAQHEREFVLCKLWSEKWKLLWSGASWTFSAVSQRGAWWTPGELEHLPGEPSENTILIYLARHLSLLSDLPESMFHS